MNLFLFIILNTSCFGSQVESSTWSQFQGEFLWLNLDDLFNIPFIFTICDSFVLVGGDISSGVFYAEWSATSLLQRLLFITAWRFEILLRCKQRLAKFTCSSETRIIFQSQTRSWQSSDNQNNSQDLCTTHTVARSGYTPRMCWDFQKCINSLLSAK